MTTDIPAADRVVTAQDNAPDPAEVRRARVKELVDDADKLVKTIPAITTEEQATRLKDKLDQLRLDWKKLDDERKALKKPHDDASDAVQDEFNPLLKQLKTAAELLLPLQRAWLAEQQRLLDAEAARLAAEAKAKLDEAAAAKAKVDASLRQNADVVMVPVDSTNMKAVGYNASTKELFIQFPAALWVYANVTDAMHKALMAADSKGTYLGKFIKARPQDYPGRLVSAASVKDTIAAEDAQTAAAAALRTADKAQGAKATVKGDFSSRATSLRTIWSAEIVDFEKAMAHYSAQPEVRDVILQLANQDAKKIKDADLAPPGVKFNSKQE